MKSLLFSLIFLFFSFNSQAQSFRTTSFDDRAFCEEQKGIWREFGNRCADNCLAKFNQFKICTSAAIYNCDCAKGRCWDGKKCVKNSEYKIIYDKKKAEEKIKLDKAKEVRKTKYIAQQQQIMQDLVNKSVVLSSDQNKDSSNQANNMNQVYKSRGIQTEEQKRAIQAEAEAQNRKKKLEGEINKKNAKPADPVSNVPPLFLQQEQSNELGLPVIPLP